MLRKKKPVGDFPALSEQSKDKLPPAFTIQNTEFEHPAALFSSNVKLSGFISEMQLFQKLYTNAYTQTHKLA